MKTMKKLQVAIAAASLFAAAGSTMAASISQSGVTIAREAISANATSTQTVRAPTTTFNFDNGPAANALSTQDFNVTLTLGGDGDAKWSAASATYKTVSALRRNNGNQIVAVLPAADALAVPVGVVAIVLLSVDVVPASNAVTPNILPEKTFRYKFRLVNNTASTIGIGDLQLNFNGQNPGDGTAAPFITGLPSVAAPAAAAADYQQVKNVQTVVNGGATVVTGAGDTGNTDDGCGLPITKVTVTARNYIGSGDGVEGESQGANAASITNNGYIQFATALAVQLAKGVAVDRNTDPLNNNNLLIANGLGTATSMALGTIKLSNRSLDAWDLSQQGAYYKLGLNDLNDVNDEKNGNVDVAAIRLNIDATNGFVAGAKFRLSNSPTCADTAGAVHSSSWLSPTFTDGTNPVVLRKSAAVSFNIAELTAAFDAANSISNVTDATVANYGSPFSDPGAAARTDRAFICMQVPNGALIPQSRFSGTGTIVKAPEDLEEQSNTSCPSPLAGLGGGIKIDVRNYLPYTAGSDWMDYVRIINNSETVTADLTAQYIRTDGTYGKWVTLGTLAPRAAKFFSSQQIDALMAASGALSSVNPSANQDATTGLNAGYNAGFNARLRISSDAASTLRVQNYFFNAKTGLLSEVSASQGADFVNIEASPRDHIDQDAQTGIKK